jgi:uracil phosphoribosyltransferase
MRTLVVDHPLVAHKLTVLRDKNTPSPVFRQLTEELVTLLAYEATREVRTEPVTIETPVSTTVGTAFTKPTPLVVPILRAGLGMLEGMTKLVPTAEVGFLGMARDEETLDIITYAERLPEDLTDRQFFVLDPMLATGGTLREAIKFLFKRGASDVTCICLLAAPEGLAKLEEELSGANVTIVLASRPPVRHRRLGLKPFPLPNTRLSLCAWTGNWNSFLCPCPMWTAPKTSTSTKWASTPISTSGPATPSGSCS